MWIKLKNRLYNLDRVLSIESESVTDRGKLSIILYYNCDRDYYMCLYFDDKVERDNVFKKIQELITYSGCSLYDFDKDDEKHRVYEMLKE